MNKSTGVLLVLIFASVSFISVVKPAISVVNVIEDYWISRASMHQPRSVLGIAVVSGKIYAIGGSTESGFSPSIPGYAVYGNINIDSFVGTNEEYDPASDTWTYKASMPTPRAVFAVAVYQDKIYCIGGRSIAGSTSGGYTGVNEVYDPATNTWETKAPMPTARGWLTAGVVDGKIYLIGGDGSNGFLNEVYDPATDSWASKASIPTPIEAGLGSVSVVVDSKIYVIDSKIQIYDPGTDSWSQGSPVPSISWLVAAGATDGLLAPKRIYIMGPQDDYKPSNGAYDPENNSWTFGANLTTRRYNFGVAVVNDTLYAIGGHTYDVGNGYFETVALNEQYTPIGYGTITPPTPSPSPSPLSSQSPIPSPSPSPSASPTPMPSASQQPTQSPEPSAISISSTEVILVAVTVVIAVSVAALAIRKHHKRKV